MPLRVEPCPDFEMRQVDPGAAARRFRRAGDRIEHLDQQRAQRLRDNPDLRGASGRRRPAEDDEPVGAGGGHRRNAIADRRATGNFRRLAVPAQDRDKNIVGPEDARSRLRREVARGARRPFRASDILAPFAGGILGDRARAHPLIVDIGYGAIVRREVVEAAIALADRAPRRQRKRDRTVPSPSRTADLQMHQTVGSDADIVFANPRRAIAIVAQLQKPFGRDGSVDEPIFDPAIVFVLDPATGIGRVIGLVLEAQMHVDDGKRRSGRRFPAVIGLCDRAG